MHELSIALSILELVEEEAGRHPGRVTAVHVKLGPLSGVVKEALVSAYNLARDNTPLEQTELIVEEVPIVAYCTGCAAARTLACVQELCCPVCGALTPEIVTGRELEVVALEMEA
jgi:hydrogenase nickel incorporation protein HypA/HybF